MGVLDADEAKKFWSGDNPTAVTMRRIFDSFPSADEALVDKIANFFEKEKNWRALKDC